MKKNLFLAALLLVAGLLNAQNRQNVDNVWYLLDSENKTATVTFRPSDTDPEMVAEENYMGRLNIPSVISVYNAETYNYEEYTVTAIGDSAFAKCPYLTAVTIPASVKTLGLYLMKDFNKNGFGDGIKELVISDGDEPIEFTYIQGETGEEFSFSEAAYTCTYLYLGRNVTVKTDVEYPSPIFHTWGSIEEVVFGENFTEVPLAFCPYSRNLWSIQINSRRVLEAGPRMFSFLEEDKPQPDAKDITLYVPYGMKDIYAADEYWNRFSIEEMDEARRYSIKYVDDVFDFFINGLYYKRTSRGVSVVLPQVWYLNHDGSYVSIYSCEFPYKQSEITIPESITLYLKDYTTYSLTPKDGYEETTLTVAGIGDYCFREARNLEHLTIPNTVKEVGVEAFEYTMKLKSLDIPESIIHTGWLAFARSGLEEVVIPASCSKWEFGQGTAVFQECENLRKATFAKGTTRIPDRIFFGCTALRTVIMPDEVTEIGPGAFSACSALSDLHLPASLEKINDRMFHSCPLRELEIPAAVKEVGEDAMLATLISKLTVAEGNTTFDSRDNCNAVIRTADNTMLAATNGAFIPESVDTIAYHAFVELDGIRSVTLPKNLKRVKTQAFFRVSNLSVITSDIEKPAGILEEDAFADWNEEDSPYWKATLYVPEGTKALYEADSEWSRFRNIVEMKGEYKPASVEDIAPVKENGAADFSKLDGKDLSNTVVDNMYITCDTEGGDHYDKTEQALILNTIVDQLMLDNILAQEGNMDILRNNFSGIVIEIPAGKGTIKIEAKVTGKRALSVYISGHAGASVNEAPATKKEIEIPFDEPKKAFVYIYGVFDSGESVPAPLRAPSKILSVPSKALRAPASAADGTLRTPKASADENLAAGTVNIYGAKWIIDEVTTGIEATENPDAALTQKLLRDGEVLILRDGKLYNMLGTEVQ